MGIVMRPCSFTEEDNERVMRTGKYWTESNFDRKYCEHIAAMQQIAESAKIYIIKNYKSVTDWRGLNLTVNDNSGKETIYYNYDESGYNTSEKFVRKILRQYKKDHNPIKTFCDVVLDPTDGDFSLKINGKNHNWIDDDSVIQIADFIEKTLTKIPKAK